MNLTAPLPAPLRVIIVEDQVAPLQDLEDFFQKRPDFIIIGTCSTVREAIALINNRKPDLLLLDIELPDGTGFDILEKISVQVKVIFLTAHNDYASQAFEYAAIHYLLKPYSERKLNEALQRAINAQPLLQEQIDISANSYRKKKEPKYIVFRSLDFVKRVKVKEIIYLHADSNYITVFLKDGKKEVVTNKPLNEYEELLSDRSFLRTHKSYLINTFYIDRYHQKEAIIYLKDATKILVSSRKKEMVDLYFKKL
jgi:two-component system LytT family response regulator